MANGRRGGYSRLDQTSLSKSSCAEGSHQSRRHGKIKSSMLAAMPSRKSDGKAACETIRRDAEINDLYNDTFSELIGTMMPAPATATPDVRSFLQHLERIGDYVTEISGLTLYLGPIID